jgi:ABC-type polysaccharide/polyol phosphate transport system ATPase subunit
MALLRFEHVTVQFPIYNSRARSLRNSLVSIGTGGRIDHESRRVITVTALKDVSFELNDGDRLGLIGHNGAGKTTLLRTMAGIYTPVSGTVTREGRTATIIEVGSGMDVELSGYENIVRMGLMLGMTHAEIRAAMPGIEELTDLGNYLNMPVRTYSAGMTMRLMFAVATSHRPEILLIDEMFGAGDAAFQKKAEERMRSLIDSASIFVFASHSIGLLQQYCQRVFKLEHGSLTEVPMP